MVVAAADPMRRRAVISSDGRAENSIEAMLRMSVERSDPSRRRNSVIVDKGDPVSVARVKARVSRDGNVPRWSVAIKNWTTHHRRNLRDFISRRGALVVVRNDRPDVKIVRDNLSFDGPKCFLDGCAPIRADEHINPNAAVMTSGVSPRTLMHLLSHSRHNTRRAVEDHGSVRAFTNDVSNDENP
jgi:hypothetical protein